MLIGGSSGQSDDQIASLAQWSCNLQPNMRLDFFSNTYVQGWFRFTWSRNLGKLSYKGEVINHSLNGYALLELVPWVTCN